MILLLLACVPDDVIPSPPSQFGAGSATCRDAGGTVEIEAAVDAGGALYAATFVGAPPEGPRVVAALPGAGHRAWSGTVVLPDVAACTELEGWSFSVVLYGRGVATSAHVCPANVPGCD
ncbi:MAG: hypothetical protein V4850_12160 [Myxococcota bacterium]